MKLSNLKPNIKPSKSKRVGRGIATGKGKTCGRGTKGQKSRSGYNLPKRFEGGQTSLIQKLPKIKITKSNKNCKQIVNIGNFEKKFKADDLVNPKTLFQKGIIKNPKLQVKIIGKPSSEIKYKIKGCQLSKQLKKHLKI